MTNNKKVLLWGSVAVLLLVAAIVYLFVGLSSGKGRHRFEVPKEVVSVYSGIPSDAVVVMDFKRLGEYSPMLYDTLSFAAEILDKNAPMVAFQEQLLQLEELSGAPFVYSLHYSAKNSVAFLQVVDITGADAQKVSALMQRGTVLKKYNGVAVVSHSGGVMAAVHNNLLLASSSSYVLESSIRHLENNTSILDKQDFVDALQEYGALSGIYVNHSQIGKFFSGVVEKGFLGYSDYFMKFTGWSCFNIYPQKGHLKLRGTLDNVGDESKFSNIFLGQYPRKSQMGEILPASTIFAVSIPVSSMQGFLKSHYLYLEMQKKAGTFAYKQKMAQGEMATEPRKWVDSLAIEEIVGAWCKFGEKCEWITLIRGKQQFGLDNVISAVVSRDKVEMPRPFAYKGYVESVFGEFFSHCNEEAVCNIGPWMLIGPAKCLEGFVNGSVNFFTLADYVSQTPADGFLAREASLKIISNIKEAGDSVLQVLKPYYAGRMKVQMEKRNFEYLTVDILPEDGEPSVELDFYVTNLAQMPAPKEVEKDEEAVFAVDSTIKIPQGPFEVRDVTKKSAAYLEQLPNMRLRYMDANRKGVWAIPFETPICGFVEQIDLYENGRLQMLFASENKLYLLDRLGRFVYGYPAKLPKKVVLGPKLVKNVNGNRYSLLTLNEDNTVSWYDVQGKPIAGWSDIVAPEFIKELPEFVKLGGVRYWIVRAPSQLLLYTIDGKPVVLQDAKKKIDRESEISLIQDGVLKIKCTDGKEYAWNLSTGKTKKL